MTRKHFAFCAKSYNGVEIKIIEPMNEKEGLSLEADGPFCREK